MLFVSLWHKYATYFYH